MDYMTRLRENRGGEMQSWWIPGDVYRTVSEFYRFCDRCTGFGDSLHMRSTHSGLRLSANQAIPSRL